MKKIFRNQIRWCVLLFSLFISHFLQAQVYINEISICNVNQELDPNYDYNGWIELYNSSDKEINIKELYFSDEEGKPMKYKLSSNRTLPAGGFAVVWLNDELKDNITGYSMDADADDGGHISVADKNGTIYDTMNYGVQYPNVSYGRRSDGNITSPLVYFIDDSYCTSNNSAITGTEVVATPYFSIKSGFYENEVEVNISCTTEGAKLYYTTDASDPTAESTLYNIGDKLVITKTTVLRAKAFKDGMLKGLIASATYMINERKPDKLPVVFLTISPENLNDDSTGIYVEGVNGIVLTSASKKANYNRDWTRWAHIELTDLQKNTILNQSVGIGISGNITREYPQKSFKVLGKTKYGKQRFDVPLFPTRNGMRYKSFLIRNGGQYFNAVQLIHDACLQSLADVTSLDYQASTPSVVYLNGSYWGIYNLRERKNKDMMYSHHGLSETDFDIVEYNWRATANNGNLTAWKAFEDKVKASDFTKNQDYDTIASLMDIDNYLYYMSIEILLKNGDWPNNNQIIFRPHAEGSKWKWILQDLDKCLTNGSSQNFLKSLYESTSSLLSTKLITYLLNNEIFKEDYITVQSLVAGSVYAPDRFKKRQLEMRDAITSEYSFYQTKWEEQGKSPLDKTTNSIISYAEAACSQMFEHLKSNFSLGDIHILKITSTFPNTPITFNNRQIPILPYDGKWFENKPINLKAPLYEKGKKFAYWEIKTVNNNITTSFETTLQILVDKDLEITAIYEPVEMVRRFGLFINEISANNATYVDNEFKYEDWIEIYNGSNKDIDIAGHYISNSKSKPTLHKISDNDPKQTNIPAGSYGIIWCSKKPERGVLHTNFKLAKEGGSIYLSKTNQSNQTELVDSVYYASHEEINSFGRYPDGGETLVTFASPSFKAANQQSLYNINSYIESFPLVSDIKGAYNTDRPVVYKESKDLLYIKCINGKTLKVISINGNIIKQISMPQDEFYLPLNDYQTGIYIIVIESDKERWGFKFLR